ncbi:MAG: aldolase/citrate lyase family protein, partial [Gammaproteobacteria bacterium]|nr:aldolase/citrate lyase family protein [Gammaproteobacteria bacterium]
MGKTKTNLRNGQPALGGWMLIGHPAIAELLAGEEFDWISVDLEHSTTDSRAFYEIMLAVKGTDCDVFARLHSCDPIHAKMVLDAGANGIIVPSINSREEAQQAVAMAKFPPEGFRGSSVCRASDFGRNFQQYFNSHNDSVLVAVMLEHIEAVANADEILSTPGIDAAFIGPYDLSASMGKSGQLDDPQVLAAQQKLLEACKRNNVAAGIHVVSVDNKQIKSRIEEGYQFIACGVD